MDEKQAFLAPYGLPEQPRAHHEPGRRITRPRPRLLLVTSLVAFLALIHMAWRLPMIGHDCSHHERDRHRYEGEKIDWEACGDVKGRPVECSTITVPMDQFNATNSGDKIFTIPLIRLRGKNATQNLLLNPGGPGASGFDIIFRRGEQLSTIVGEGFHILSFDPRGVNSSTPMASCFPDNDARRALQMSVAGNTRVTQDSPQAYAFASNFVQACADTMGEHGRYINTPQTAADMNSILDAVGQEDMVYWGISYGTLLGQTYAGLFPERSKRVILDGVVNQFDWYEELTNTEDFTDTENVLAGFFDECVKAGQNCTLSAASTSEDGLMDKFLRLAESLAHEPLGVYINKTTWGTLDDAKIVYKAVFPALYKPASWYELADRLSNLLSGNATDAFLAWGLSGDPWSFMGEALSFVAFNDGKSGLEYWPKDRRSALEIIAPVINSSLFAPAENGALYVKQQWTIPKTHNYVPKMGVKTAHPLLILSTTYDPICPLVSARSANKAFAGSQIVEVKGYGHCSVAVTSNCVARHVRGFLYNGTVPENYTQCEVDGPYFVKPADESGKTVTALRDFEDPEEMKIHVAQLQLARDPDWPIWSRW